MSFQDRLDEISKLHDLKQADYGSEEDPYANVRAASDWGMPPWVGAAIRMDDKLRRLKRFVNRGWVANEGIEDSLQDIAVYSLIALDIIKDSDDLLSP